MELLDKTLEIIQNNNVLSGAMSLSITGIILYLLKETPYKIYLGIKSQFVTTVNLSNYHISYYEFMKWFENSKYKKYSRKLQVINGKNGWSEEFTLSAGFGSHILRFKNKWIIFNISKQVVANATHEEVNLQYLGRSHEVLEDLIKELTIISKSHKDDSYKIFDYDRGWGLSCYETKRNFNTIAVDPQITDKITSNIKWFFENKKHYESCGIPYRFTILLYGPPGTGKTSIIKALATTFNKDICRIKCSQASSLKDALVSSYKDSIVVLEDVDSLDGSEDRTSENENKAYKLLDNTSNVLNSLDGIGSFTDKVLIMTTNHIEKLDAAFLRPGRVDLKVEITDIDEIIANDFLKKLGIDYKVSGKIKGCDLQKIIRDIKINGNIGDSNV